MSLSRTGVPQLGALSGSCKEYLIGWEKEVPRGAWALSAKKSQVSGTFHSTETDDTSFSPVAPAIIKPFGTWALEDFLPPLSEAN